MTTTRGAALLAAAALGCWAGPAVLRSGPLRAAVAPALAGRAAPGRTAPDRTAPDRAAPGTVALSFDDGPDPEGTPRVLDVLDRLGWHATFFMLGGQVRRHPDVAARVVAAGHEAAVHGFTHRNHLARGPRDVLRDVGDATTLVRDVTGTTPRWFRPPYGVLTLASLAAARRTGLRPVLWTAWGRDWSGRTPEQVAATVARGLRPGGTVLLHDSDCTAEVAGSWRGAVGALPLLAEVVGRLGCTVVPLREHLRPGAR